MMIRKILLLLIGLIYFYQLNAVEQTPNLTSYLQENYDILFLNQKQHNLEKIKFFLLAEQHDQIGHKHIHSEFINLFSGPKDVILVEGVPSLFPINKEESLPSIWLKTLAPIMGWDSNWMQKITGIDTNEMDLFGIQLIDLTKRIAECSSQAARAKLLDQYQQLTKKLIPHLPKIQQMMEESFLDKIKETFPARLEAKLNTLQAVSKTHQHIFLIAGLYHLWQDTTHPFFQGADTSLESLYAFLATQDAVILMPKIDKTTYWNQFYQINSLLDL
jgi:hypothetical protein